MKVNILFLFISSFFFSQVFSSLEEIERRRKEENKPVIILFSTDWCAVCKIQKKSIEGLPNEIKDKVYLITINPEKYRKDIVFLGDKYSYISNGTAGLHEIYLKLVGDAPMYPSWVFIDKRNEKQHYQGLLNEAELIELLNKE